MKKIHIIVLFLVILNIGTLFLLFSDRSNVNNDILESSIDDSFDMEDINTNSWDISPLEEVDLWLLSTLSWDELIDYINKVQPLEKDIAENVSIKELINIWVNPKYLELQKIIDYYYENQDSGFNFVDVWTENTTYVQNVLEFMKTCTSYNEDNKFLIKLAEEIKSLDWEDLAVIFLDDYNDLKKWNISLESLLSKYNDYQVKYFSEWEIYRTSVIDIMKATFSWINVKCEETLFKYLDIK